MPAILTTKADEFLNELSEYNPNPVPGLILDGVNVTTPGLFNRILAHALEYWGEWLTEDDQEAYRVGFVFPSMPAAEAFNLAANLDILFRPDAMEATEPGTGEFEVTLTHDP